MTGPRIDVASVPRVPTGDEWAQQQYLAKAPPKAATGKETTNLGRVPTGDEWEAMQRLPGPALKALRIPLLPPISAAPRDVTRTPTDPNAKGQKLAPFDIKDPTTYANPILRQVINPALENPFTTAAMGVAPFAAAGASPIAGLAVGGAMAGSMVYHIAQYGWQKAAELSLSPEDRARAEADPERISGESAAVQAAMLGLGPLIHVGVKGYRNLDVSPGMMEAGAKAAGEAGAYKFRPGFDDAHKNADFARAIELDIVPAQAYARAGNQPARPKGFEELPSSRAGAGAKPVEGLEVPETAKAGKVKPVETLPPNATLAEKAAYNEAVREYEAKRLVQEQEELSAARAKDAEKIAKADAMRPGRRAKASFFESEQGAEVLGMTAARHGLAPDASPYVPDTPLDVAWKNGHTATTESFPEGFSMGGSLADSRIPGRGEIPKVARGIEGLQQSEPVAPLTESEALVAALNPRLRERISPPAPVTEPVAAETGSARGLTPVEGTGDVRTRGLSAGVEAKAVAAKLDAAMGDLPEYRQISMADQATRASELLASDPALARRVALGEAPAPEGLLPESVFVAVENRAIAEGDVATIRDLATGKLTSEATTMGQRIRALGERDTDSPIAAIKSVVDARTKGAKGGVPKATLETVAQIRAQLEGLKVTPDAWTAFIESLKC